MNLFTHPIKTKPKGNTELTYSFEEDDVIFAPYDGVITKVTDDSCGKRIEISHNVDNKTYKSVLCNAQDTILQPGNKVRKNEPIAQTFESGKLTYTLFDENGKKISPKELLIHYMSDRRPRSRYYDDSSMGNLSKKIGRIPVDIFKFPFNMITKSKDKKLKEEIDRIKTLL